MPRYRWVNHKQTFRQEIDGTYLWSPKRKANGARNVFYENMRAAVPGDLVLSFADGLIRHVGRVAEFAFTAPKPEEFGSTGGYWSAVGWLLPVYWVTLANPVRPRDLIATLGPLLPGKYSPISPTTGYGLQSAYLAEIPQSVFDIIVGAGSAVGSAAYDVDALRRGGANSLSYSVVSEEMDDAVEKRVAADLTLDDTTRRTVIQARRGQGRFRDNVHAVERVCRLTGITNPTLLIASHIKPWRLCETAAERLDGMNGLMLTPDADLLFDRGFVTFHDDGRPEVSKRFNQRDLERLGLGGATPGVFGLSEAQAPYVASGLRAEQCAYMDYHRRAVFVA
ncbi:MAG: HNH endonuclease signature motif containing protein [Thalassobaculum sp.]|uniref:HNH endonuclease n=1 Tax=Thalassobaculum sp. TaxID=2022740 RepID=UPI0032EF3904